MSTERVEIRFGGDVVVMSWDGAQASAPILVDNESTGYQTADARHRTADAVRLVAGKCWPEESFAAGSEAWAALAYDTLSDGGLCANGHVMRGDTDSSECDECDRASA